MSPKDAGMAALKRIKSQTIEKRLLNDRGEPNFGVNFYIVNVKGEYAGVTMRQNQHDNRQFRRLHRKWATVNPIGAFAWLSGGEILFRDATRSTWQLRTQQR